MSRVGPEPGGALRDRHLVVVGGGVGGAALALLLAGAGGRVTLLERVSQPREVGAGILLQPNGLAVLHGLGLGRAVEQRGTRLWAAVVSDGARRPILRAALPNFGEGLDHALVIRRSDLFGILLDAVEAQPGIDAHYGAEAQSAKPQGLVTYVENSRRRTLEADLIVAADGVHSAVRGRGSFGARVRPTGVSYVRGLSPATISSGEAAEAWTRLGIFGMAPLPRGSYFYSSVRAPVLAEAVARCDLDGFRSAWAQAYPASRAVLDAVDRFDALLVNQVIEVRCQRFSDDKLVLLGDAAHAMAPNLGQGANSALVDAVVLAHELSSSADWPAALQRYEARRRPAVTRVQRLAGRLAWAGDWQHPVARWLRDQAAQLLVRRPADAERATREAQQEAPIWLLHSAHTLSGAGPGQEITLRRGWVRRLASALAQQEQRRS